MSLAAIAQVDGAPPATNTDFMCRGFEYIKEPLNLWEAGQDWFTRVYQGERRHGGSTGLALGATPWLGRLLQTTERRAILADISLPMLEMCRASLAARPADADAGHVELVHADWLGLPESVVGLGAVVGDNSFSFLSFPDGWARLRDSLAERMIPGATLVTRVCSVPLSHRSVTIARLVDRALAHDGPINFTAVRAALLFAHWDRGTYGIQTEMALATFESNRRLFDRLFEAAPVTPDNDLLTIEKYRGSGAVYYAPPLPDVIQLFAGAFRVRAVHYGPYPMSEYFPLVVASKV